MSAFESKLYPGSSFQELASPIATSGVISFGPGLKTGIFTALGDAYNGNYTGMNERTTGSRFNPAIGYLATGTYMLAAESAGHEDPILYARERMKTNGLTCVTNDGWEQSLDEANLGWAAQYASGIDHETAKLRPTHGMLVAARLIHALRDINYIHGSNSVDVSRRLLARKTLPGKLSVDASMQGDMIAQTDFADGSTHIFSSSLPTVWDAGVVNMEPKLTTRYAYTAQSYDPDSGKSIRNLSLMHFQLPKVG